MNTTALPLETESMLAEARRRTGLEDFGDPWFLAPLRAQVDGMRTEARLSPTGRVAMVERALGGLVTILRLTDALTRHPEIREEPVEVAAIVCGLPRTGSTMLHRLLANHPGMTACLWWEATFPTPFPGERRGDPSPRQKAARDLVAWMCESMPELLSMHPMDADQVDEEILIMEQGFVSTTAEMNMHLPTYSAFIEGLDKRPVYRFLLDVLKYLQWQDVSRRHKRWVLKTPFHLTGLPAALEIFPQAKVVMTHRDPVQIIPSWASFAYTLMKLGSDEVDPREIGRHWTRRWSNALREFVATRAREPAGRFIDVFYDDQTRDPVGTAKEVFRRLDIAIDAEAEARIVDWIAINGRDKRPSHKYDMATFGLSAPQIEAAFDFYLSEFPLRDRVGG